MGLQSRAINLYRRFYQRSRIWSAHVLSTCQNVKGKPIINQPLYAMGAGTITFGENVNVGFGPSPFFYDGSAYIEARERTASITFGNNIVLNNNFVIICERSSVTIGDMVLIGPNVEIMDSDFHEIHPDRRCSGKHKTSPVVIGRNVFLGSNVRIMKGVEIGENSVVGNSAVVYENVPPNVIVAGNPAKIIKQIEIG